MQRLPRVRFVCFGYICNQLILSEGQGLGFEARPFPIRELLQKSKDKDLQLGLDNYERAILGVSETKL